MSFTNRSHCSEVLIRSVSKRLSGSMASVIPLSAARLPASFKPFTAKSHSFFFCSGGTWRRLPTAEYIGPASVFTPASLHI
jgi:hypothetical protein